MITDIPNLKLDSSTYILEKVTKTRGAYVDHILSITNKETGNIHEWQEVVDKPVE